MEGRKEIIRSGPVDARLGDYPPRCLSNERPETTTYSDFNSHFVYQLQVEVKQVHWQDKMADT